MIMAQREVEPDRTLIDLKKPIGLPRPTTREEDILLAKRTLEQGLIQRPREKEKLSGYADAVYEDISVRKFAVKRLYELGETEYLIKIKGVYTSELAKVRQMLEKLEAGRPQMNIDIGIAAYNELKKQIPRDEWDRMSKKEQEEMLLEASVRVSSQVIPRHEYEVKRLEDLASSLEQVIKEIEGVIPPIKLDL